MHDLPPTLIAERLRELLTTAGKRAQMIRADARVSTKPDGSPVSTVDRELDRWFAEQLPRAFPGVGVVGEEGAKVEGSAGAFHVDPIDGTQAYLDGLAYWGPAVSLVRDGEVVAGAFYAPDVDVFWFAAQGHGAFRNGDRITQRPSMWPLRKQVVLVPSRFHRRAPIPWPGKVRAFGSAAAHLALVAEGAAVATIIPRWALWDVGCGVLLVREAGGEVRALDGSPVDVVNGPQGLPFMAGAPTALQSLATALTGRNDVEG